MAIAENNDNCRIKSLQINFDYSFTNTSVKFKA